MPITEREREHINALVGRFEAATGVQALAAVVAKADAYPEIPWKAYALGSAIGALAVLAWPLNASGWSDGTLLGASALAALGAGVVMATLSLIPMIARLFLDPLRAQAEVRQYALQLFAEREVFCTAQRRAVLVLVSRFEARAIILADRGLAQYAPAADLERIGAAMAAELETRGATGAFDTAFTELEALMNRHGHVATPLTANELADTVISERGA